MCVSVCVTVCDGVCVCVCARDGVYVMCMYVMCARVCECVCACKHVRVCACKHVRVCACEHVRTCALVCAHLPKRRRFSPNCRKRLTATAELALLFLGQERVQRQRLAKRGQQKVLHVLVGVGAKDLHQDQQQLEAGHADFVLVLLGHALFNDSG